MTRIVTIIMTMLCCGGAMHAQLYDMTMKAKGFTSLSVNGPLTVECRQVPDSAGMVVARATRYGMSLLNLATTGNVLNIGVGHGKTRGHFGVITVYTDSPLTSVMVNGRARVSAPSLGGEDKEVSVVLSGSGRVNVSALTCRSLSVSLTGSGTIEIGGCQASEIVNATCSGSGTVDVSGISAPSVNATVSGTGYIIFSGAATKGAYAVKGTGSIISSALSLSSLKAVVYDGGTITYHPALRTKTFSGNTQNIVSGQEAQQ